jgi:hypothetical protein
MTGFENVFGGKIPLLNLNFISFIPLKSLKESVESNFGFFRLGDDAARGCSREQRRACDPKYSYSTVHASHVEVTIQRIAYQTACDAAKPALV